MDGTTGQAFRVMEGFGGVVRALGVTADGVFADPRIVVWRDVTERQNCTLDGIAEDGRRVRLHVKRYRPVRGRVSPAAEECAGIRLLDAAGVPTVPLVAHGDLPDGRSFVITEDLAGFRPADKLIAEAGVAFETLLGPTADLAARLHAKGLHHRDLYLCHFFVRLAEGGGAVEEIRLIDPARVRPLPGFLTRRRWVVKDLAQFWYSTLALPVTDEQRRRWLDRYLEQRKTGGGAGLEGAVRRKAASIARHDAKLRAAQPKRNVSLR